MRRYGMVIFAIFMAVGISLSGCVHSNQSPKVPDLLPQNAEKQLVALELSAMGDTCDSGIHSSDYDLWSYEKCSFHKEESAPQTIEVLFGDSEYKGVYDCSYVELHNTYITHRYNMEDGWFSINGDTGELVGFLYYDLETGTLKREDCAVVARKFAASLVDIEQYQFSESFEDPLYACSYVKYLDGVETGERIDITVSTTGRITAFNSKMIGAFGDEEKMNVMKAREFSALLSKEAEQLVVEKMDKIYPKKARQYTFEKRKYVLLPDGEIAMVYDVESKESIDTGDKSIAIFASVVQILVRYK